MIPFFQCDPVIRCNMFPYFFCPFWNWIIYYFSSILQPWSNDNTSDILNVHYDPFYPYNQSLLAFRLIVLYHISHYRTSVLFCFLYLFLQFISHLQRKENSCYNLLNLHVYSFILCFVMHPSILLYYPKPKLVNIVFYVFR